MRNQLSFGVAQPQARSRRALRCMAGSILGYIRSYICQTIANIATCNLPYKQYGCKVPNEYCFVEILGPSFQVRGGVNGHDLMRSAG